MIHTVLHWRSIAALIAATGTLGFAISFLLQLDTAIELTICFIFGCVMASVWSAMFPLWHFE